ncbi:MAG: hypothetical protein CME70_21605 [Halobacteriovorax sp.]|nr:hypothetical protein [Halobacteriovorax sp.]|tara:strand:+ start:25090 stop:25956 length:867 start_codon:yes stop_codon:yes gene_type:complete
MNCLVCNSKTQLIFDKPIRLGKPGTLTPENRKVFQCKKCHVAFLEKYNIDYESDEYRNLVNKDASPESYYNQHDPEQIERLELIGFENVRNKTVADIGCGSGSFLDLVSTSSSKVLAIEPTSTFKDELTRKGFEHFPYAKDALNKYKSKVDYLTSFAVIEHVDDALEFLKDCFELLSDDGLAVISTPNHDDWLIDFMGDTYKEFYYRNVHKWYFNFESFSFLAKQAGFSKVEAVYRHQYDLSNMLFWLKESKPTGNGKINLFSEINNDYKKVLEKEGISNYVYFKLSK